MKFRWTIVALALLAAAGFACAVQLGRWWAVGDVEVGPFGSRHCFAAGGCQPAGLGWIGGTPQWMRFGMATWAGGLIAMFALVVMAAAIAARRVPRLAAKAVLVSIATAAITGTVFIAQFPGIDGAHLDRGAWLFGGAVLLGIVAAIGVLRARKPA